MVKLTFIFVVLAALMLPASSDAANPPQVPTSHFVLTTPTFTTSFTCNDGNTPVQNIVCTNQQLAGLDLQLGAVYQAHLGSADIFQRDQLLAAQWEWLLTLPAICDLDAGPAISATPAAVTCLSSAYRAQISMLTNWPKSTAAPSDLQSKAMAHYVNYKLFAYKELDAGQSQILGITLPKIFAISLPNICTAIGDHTGGALTDDGAVDPAKMDGATEIAGSHGSVSGVNPQGGKIFVDLYRAGLFGGYQIRARSVSLSKTAPPLLGPFSVGDYVRTWSNDGGRYVNLASQTGDYGDIDVFTFHGQLLAMMTDTIGFNSPAPPGEAAVAAVFTIKQNIAAPTCLFETYLMPPPISMGTFGKQPALTPFLTLIDSMRGSPSSALGPSDRQDAYYFAADTRWMVLNMPLATLAQAKAGNWAGWLRSRHDQVLDSLYIWSQKSPQNEAMFDALFLLLRPAAKDLETVYIQQQGLTTKDAEQASALAMMELLYQSTINFAPGLGGDPVDPLTLVHYKPRYAILASPQ